MAAKEMAQALWLLWLPAAESASSSGGELTLPAPTSHLCSLTRMSETGQEWEEGDFSPGPVAGAAEAGA